MKIALEVSGGKDSLALVQMYLPELGRMTVYWCNPGDPDPEVLKSIAWIKERAPNFVEVNSDVKSFRRQFGAAASVVPLSEEFPTISDQICCMYNIMLPLQTKVLADGNTRIIRGQKTADRHKGTLRSGDVVEGVEYIYPLEGWTDDDVMNYLAQHHVPIPPVYHYSKHGTDCLHCSGWWAHGHMGYLKDHHPEAYSVVKLARRMIRATIEKEVAEC